jgi:ubiquitin C-terminal hydrolase
LPRFSNPGTNACFANTVAQSVLRMTKLTCAIDEATINEVLTDEQENLCIAINTLASQKCFEQAASTQNLRESVDPVLYSQPTQQDVHEFWSHLFEKLPTRAKELCEFTSIVKRHCDVCRTSDENEEMDSCLILKPRNSKDRQNFDDLLSKEETVEKMCQQCGVDRAHKENRRAIFLPNQKYLVVNLNLFYDEKKWNEREKRMELNFKRIVDRKIVGFNNQKHKIFDANFKAIAAVEHSGAGIGSGHYTCWIRSPDDSKWIYANDDQIKPMDKFKSNLKDIYLLFLEKM